MVSVCVCTCHCRHCPLGAISLTDSLADSEMNEKEAVVIDGAHQLVNSRQHRSTRASTSQVS